jgi:hypothetical protein
LASGSSARGLRPTSSKACSNGREAPFKRERSDRWETKEATTLVPISSRPISHQFRPQLAPPVFPHSLISIPRIKPPLLWEGRHLGSALQLATTLRPVTAEGTTKCLPKPVHDRIFAITILRRVNRSAAGHRFLAPAVGSAHCASFGFAASAAAPDNAHLPNVIEIESPEGLPPAETTCPRAAPRRRPRASKSIDHRLFYTRLTTARSIMTWGCSRASARSSCSVRPNSPTRWLRR